MDSYSSASVSAPSSDGAGAGSVLRLVRYEEDTGGGDGGDPVIWEEDYEFDEDADSDMEFASGGGAHPVSLARGTPLGSSLIRESSRVTSGGASGGNGSRRRAAVNSTSHDRGFQHTDGATLNVLQKGRQRAIVRPKAAVNKPKYGPGIGMHTVDSCVRAVELMANLKSGPFGANVLVYAKPMDDGTYQLKLACALNWYGQSVSYELTGGCFRHVLQMAYEDMLRERIGGPPGAMLEQVFDAFDATGQHTRAVEWMEYLSEYEFFTTGKEPNREVIQKMNMTINAFWFKIWNQAQQMHFRGWFGITGKLFGMEPHLLTLLECAPPRPRTVLGKAGQVLKKAFVGGGRA